MGHEPTIPRGSEPATEDFLDRVRRKGRTIVFAAEGSDDLRYLDYWRANANVGGEAYNHILLREDPRLLEVWEEFLHGTQFRAGIIKRMGETEAEIHVKQFMRLHARLIGLTGGDVAVLADLLREQT